MAVGLNIGALFGYAAVGGTLYWPVVAPLYIAGLAWTLFYDSIYAFQDIEADEAAGFYSSSQKMAPNAKLIMSALASVAVVANSIAGLNAGLDPSFLYFMGAGAGYLGW